MTAVDAFLFNLHVDGSQRDSKHFYSAATLLLSPIVQTREKNMVKKSRLLFISGTIKLMR